MADISKILTDAWIKVNQGIGSAANSIADATKEKVTEINLNSRKQEIMNALSPKLIELYKQGVTLPEEIAAMLSELTAVEEKIVSLKPAPAAPAILVEEEAGEAEETVETEVTDADAPVIEVDVAETEVVEVTEDITESSAEEDDVAYEAEATDNESASNAENETSEELHEACAEAQGDEAEATRKCNDPMEADAEKTEEQNDESTFSTVNHVLDELEKVGTKAADAVKYATENPEKAFDSAAETAGKVVDGLGKAADKAADYAKKVLEDPEKAADAAADHVGKVVDGLGKAAEKAASALSSFIDGLTHKDDAK